MCQLSKDRRMRNPGEKPLIAPEPTPAPVETEVAKPKAKQPKEDPIHVSVPPPVVEKSKKTTKIQRRQTVEKKKLAEQAAAKAKKKAEKEAEKSAEKKLKDISNDDCHHASNVMLTLSKPYINFSVCKYS
ncbi:hypothetical protein Tco_1562978 [Tanacetum coccineum]